MCQFLADLFSEEGYAAEVAHNGTAALERHRAAAFDLIITDLMMPGMRGTELVSQLKKIDPNTLVLLITAFGTIESAVEAMRAGAFYYVTKPFRSDEILLHASRALEERNLRKELRRLRSEVRDRYRFENIVGKSEKIREVFEVAAHISDLTANVLIVGESGTGKEMIARANPSK
jgi:DNA-binding NtrC family response regulator